MQNQPLYEKCKLAIIDFAVQSSLPIGGMLPSQRKLCTMTGHSMITVRRAIAELENEGLVRSLPGKGVFVEHSFEAAESTRGVVVLFDIQKFHRDINNGLYMLQKKLHDRGLELRVITRSAEDGCEPDAECISWAARSAGVIFSGIMNERWLNFLRGSNKPVVVAGDNNGTPVGMKVVSTALQERLNMAFEYFCGRDCRRFAFINAGADYLPSLGMEESFFAELTARGLAVRPELYAAIGDEGRSCEVFRFLERTRGMFDCLLVQSGLVTDVLDGFFELDLAPCHIGVVDNFWTAHRSLNRRVVRFGARQNIFELAVNVILDQIKPPALRQYNDDFIQQPIEIILPVEV